MNRQTLVYFLILISIIYLFGCQQKKTNITEPEQQNSPQKNKEDDNENNNEDDSEPTLAEIEKNIRNEFDARAKFTYELYDSLLGELSNAARYQVMSLNDFIQTTDDSKILVGLRHDIDANPFKAMEMAALEESRGFSSTYYVLHSTSYYGRSTEKGFVRNKAMSPVYQTIFNRGHEIGIHNDLIQLIVFYNIDPIAFITDEIEYYTQLGIPVWGTSAHGGRLVLQNNLNNYYVFSDYNQDLKFECEGEIYLYSGGYFAQDSLFIYPNFADTTSAEIVNTALPPKLSLHDYGFEYEAYHIEYNKYLTDSGGKWKNGSITDPIDFIRQCKAGDRLVILTHPLWWGRK